MPRVGQPTRFQLALAAIAEFESGFRRSQRGNLWRNWEGATVTVFKRDDGSYAWCIVSDDEASYSRSSYETEQAAMEALGSELDV